MFDNLRERADTTPFYEDDSQFEPENANEDRPLPDPSSRHFLGMSALQRFVVAALLMVLVFVLGIMLLLVTGRIGLV